MSAVLEAPPTEVEQGATDTPPQTVPGAEAATLPTTQSLTAALLKEFGKPGAEETPPEPPAGQEPSPAGEEGNLEPGQPKAGATGEIPNEKEKGERLDLGRYKLPPEIAEQVQKDFAKAMTRKHEKVKTLRSEAETAREERDAERAQREALAAEVAKLKGEKPAADAAAPTTKDPLDAHPQLQPLRKVESEALANWRGARSLLAEMSNDPDAAVAKLVQGKFVPEGTGIDEAKAWLEAQADTWVEKLNETRVDLKLAKAELRKTVEQQFVTDRESALKLYPWHQQKDSEERKMAQAIVAQFPGIVNLPNHLTLLGRLVEGEKLERAKSKTNGHAPIPPKPATPRLPGASQAVPQRPRADATSSSALFAQYQKSGSPSDKEAWMRSLAGDIPKQ